MNNNKQIVKLQLDYLQGPIWISDIETGEPFTGIEIIDTDARVWELNKKIGQRFSSYYEFDSHDQPCWFNEAQRNADRELMLGWLQQLKNRLDEINDGSFVVEDLETPAWEKI